MLFESFKTKKQSIQGKQSSFKECVQGPDIYLSVYTAIYLFILLILHYVHPCLLSCFPEKMILS